MIAIANSILHMLTGFRPELKPQEIVLRGTTLFDVAGSATYELVRAARETGIKCRKCGLTSWHPEDVSHRYCAACAAFHTEQTQP